MDFYRKIVEPILVIDSGELRRLAWTLESAKPDDDDNLSRDARVATAEVLNRVARVKNFTDWILSDELAQELKQDAETPASKC